jgi:hypothetical protein
MLLNTSMNWAYWLRAKDPLDPGLSLQYQMEYRIPAFFRPEETALSWQTRFTNLQYLVLEIQVADCKIKDYYDEPAYCCIEPSRLDQLARLLEQRSCLSGRTKSVLKLRLKIATV